MSLPVTVLKMIGPSIAKKLLDSFKIDSALQEAIALDDIKLPQNCSNEINRIFKQFEKHLRHLFEHEVTNLPANSQKAIVSAVAQSLTKLQPDTLAENNLNPDKITQYLLEANPTAYRDFTLDEKDLYEKAIYGLSKSLIAIAPEIKGVKVSVNAKILQRTKDIADGLKSDRDRSIQAEDQFTQRYRKKVEETLDRLEVFGLPRMDRLTSRQSLSMAYITLSVSGGKDFDEKSQQLSLMGSLEPELRNRSHRIDEVICDCPRLVIRGAAGAGKSTFLQWLGARAASQSFRKKLQHWNYKIPFFIRLRSLKDSTFPTPEEFVKLTAPNFAKRMPETWVHDYLDRGQALVLIDGVDELPRKKRWDFFERLKDFVQDFPNATYVITSRPSGLKNDQGEEWPEWEDWVKDKGFVNLTLEPMSNHDVEEFIDRWHCALSGNDERSNSQAEDPSKIAENLKRQLPQRSELRRLASTPLLCAMICALHRDRLETLPSSRLQLYRECIDMLLDRRDKGRKIPRDNTYPRLREDQKIELLQSLALKLMRLNLSQLEADRVDDHFQTELTKFGLPKDIAGKQIRQLFVDRAGLLRQPVVGQIDFAHRTFQEYLAAKAALADDSFEEILGKATDDQWRESIIVTAGLGTQKQRDNLLRNLIDQGNDLPEQKHYLHLLAVACLETATSINPKTRDYVLACAKKLLPPTDRDRMMMVVRAGDRVVPLLKYESHYSAEEACQCIDTLILIGTPAAMATLVDYAKARFESEKQQWFISGAIGQGWDVFDRHDYIYQVFCHLQILDLSGTEISDISPLSELTQLTKLDLSHTQVTDLSPLSGLTQLTELNLWETEVTDLSPLSGLTQLTALSLSETEVTDLSPLSGLTQLTELYLSETEVTDLSPLSGLTQLTELDLWVTQVRDLSPLSGLIQLTELYLSITQVRDLSPLSGLIQLTTLNLSATQVTDLSPLRKLTQLTKLDLARTQVTDILPLIGLTQLKQLDLSGTQVTDLSPLSELTQLKQLDLSETQITDLSPLKNLSGIIILTDNEEKFQQWHATGMNFKYSLDYYEIDEID